MDRLVEPAPAIGGNQTCFGCSMSEVLGLSHHVRVGDRLEVKFVELG